MQNNLDQNAITTAMQMQTAASIIRSHNHQGIQGYLENKMTRGPMQQEAKFHWANKVAQDRRVNSDLFHITTLKDKYKTVIRKRDKQLKALKETEKEAQQIYETYLLIVDKTEREIWAQEQTDETWRTTREAIGKVFGEVPKTDRDRSMKILKKKAEKRLISVEEREANKILQRTPRPRAESTLVRQEMPTLIRMTNLRTVGEPTVMANSNAKLIIPVQNTFI